MKIIYGDLLGLASKGMFDVVIHGCNCQCKMARGFALQVKDQYPEAYEVDLKTEKGSFKKLGSYSHALVNKNDSSFRIINAYTQYHWSGPHNVDYSAIRSAMQAIKQDFSGCRLGYPLIGAGLAGGDWLIIKKIIHEELEGEDHSLVKLKPDRQYDFY